MQLDKTIARLANFIFKIGVNLFIELINLDILLGSIIFYMMSFNTLFLIYLVDIDKFRVFFNNITNYII